MKRRSTKEAASAASASRTEALASLRTIDTDALEIIAETIIEILDGRDGDIEAEDGDEDCCKAGDDIGSKNHRVFSFSHLGESTLGFPGDPSDAEDDEIGWSNPAMPEAPSATPFERMIRR